MNDLTTVSSLVVTSGAGANLLSGADLDLSGDFAATLSDLLGSGTITDSGAEKTLTVNGSDFTGQLAGSLRAGGEWRSDP